MGGQDHFRQHITDIAPLADIIMLVVDIATNDAVESMKKIIKSHINQISDEGASQENHDKFNWKKDVVLLVVANKQDLVQDNQELADKRNNEIQENLNQTEFKISLGADPEIFKTSAKFRTNIDALWNRVRETCERQRNMRSLNKGDESRCC